MAAPQSQQGTLVSLRFNFMESLKTITEALKLSRDSNHRAAETKETRLTEKYY